MIKLSLPLLAATLVATTSVALADEKADLIGQLDPYIRAPRYFEESGWNEASRFDPEAAPCMQAVDKLRALGVDPNERFPGYMSETWSFKQAPALCQKYKEFQLKIRGSQAIERVAGQLQRHDIGGFAHISRDDLEECVSKLDALVADGLANDAMINFNGYDHTQIKVSDAREGCKALLATASEQAEKDEKEAEAREQANLAMWAKLGVSGDRLKVIKLKEAHILGGEVSFTIKGCEATSDPKKLAKAKVLRDITHNDDGLTIDVRSYFFKGNKLLRTTNVTWARGSMHAACK